MSQACSAGVQTGHFFGHPVCAFVIIWVLITLKFTKATTRIFLLLLPASLFLVVAFRGLSVPMSSFQLNLSNLTLGAKERLARLDAAGGFKALLSPPASLSTASAPGVLSGAVGSPAASSSLDAPPPAVSRTSIELLVAQGGGVGSGEFSVAGGLSGGLPVFVVSPELLSDMCCGAVAGGVKFCTLRAADCSFTTHTKKVDVVQGSLYISTSRNSAFTHHHASIAGLSDDQLADLLKERHAKEVWIRLLRGLVQSAEGGNPLEATGGNRSISVLEAVTPARKRKVRYDDETLVGTLFATPGKRENQDSTEDELVIIPSVDSADQSSDEKVAMIISQWNPIVTSVNKLGGQVHNLRSMISEDLAHVDTRVLDLDARLGSAPARCGFEDCGTVWDGLSLLQSLISDLTRKVDDAGKLEIAQLRDKVDQVSQALRQALESKVRGCLMDVQAAFDGISEVLNALGQEQAKLAELVLQHPRSDASGGAELAHLSARLRMVEARLPSNPGRLVGETFQSRVDVLSFVERHIPSNCFYLFHDVVTHHLSCGTEGCAARVVPIIQGWGQRSIRSPYGILSFDPPNSVWENQGRDHIVS